VIKRLIELAVVAAAVALVIQSVPDIKRYLEIRSM
jgi:uncharacterized protein DUF6893